ncbi:sigma-70 family RNA polymerase sigma factor [Janthinobacterium sp. FT14W]|uniref:sigma-70 family RNA polymerase sigma factor n=1 Tax=Janthinobacterium sp. FT14W TaxID=2654253 RepID=UPI0012641423|nr:sigma-70 family RNA polymerase sigma factor [Janthinobacterium sp. FT14W]KAB8061877.1 sigma-70 family RNA polymerase sigma factor [Janthinobacterium sp. FT14W]
MSTISPSLDIVSDLYSRHHGWLVNSLWRKLGCRDGAADLAQDTFVRMLATQSADSLREPRAYLSTVANGLLVNHWRRLTLERTFLAALAGRPEMTAPSPEERALVVETLCRIDAMLDTLSPRARQAFLLAQLDGLTYAQIAGQLDVSERMVKKYMAQAMLQCMLCMDDAA